MPAITRLSDISFCPADAHLCPACAHPVQGPAISASPNVIIESKPALRKGDNGIHAACCGPNTWVTSQASPNVYANGIPVVRLGDKTKHCGGTGYMITANFTVFANG